MRTPIVARFARFARGVFLLSAAAPAIYAQNSSAAPQAPASTQSSAPAQSSALAQSSATQPSTSPDATSQTPPKRVWTNEDLGSSHSKPDRPSRSQSSANSDAPAKPKSKRDAQWYHDQIARLQGQIPPLDKTIAELQAAIDGKNLNEPIHYGGNRIGDWKEQLQQLQTKRQDILDRISSLEDEGRHNGIEPNALP